MSTSFALFSKGKSSILYFLLNVWNLFIAVKFGICIVFDLLFVKIVFIRIKPRLRLDKLST